jgi:transposase-like protein
MVFHVFLFFLLLCLAWHWHFYWLHHNPPHSRVGAIDTTIQRILKPRTPLDCSACRLSSTHSSGVEPVSLPVRPWREVKSRRGPPKRINTQGFACPNHQCPYFGITDAHIHALVGDGTHGRAEQIQTFRCQACHTTFSARRHTPLYRLKTPSHQVAVVLTALGSWARSFSRRACLRLPASHDHYLVDSSWRVRTDLARALLLPSPAPTPPVGRTAHQTTQLPKVLWLWLAIDPCTKLLPVLHLGPRTQNVAHMVIHSCDNSWLLAASHSSPVIG